MTRVRAVVFTLLFFVHGMAAAGYSSLYVFGDSLSDDGNAHILSGGAATPSPPYAQRYSNGPVAAEYLADRLGVDLAPSRLGGTNYAVGGATTGTKNYAYETSFPSELPDAMENTGMLTQFESFLQTAPTFVPDQSLFMVWGGANDMFLALDQEANIESAIGAAVGNLASIVAGLAQMGATDFLVPNLPNLALIPFGLMQSETDRLALNALSFAFNDALGQALDAVRNQFAPLVPGFTLTEFDVAGFQQDVILDPASYGLDNVSDACFLPNDPETIANVLGGCQGYMFFDEVHPSTAAHAVLADRFVLEVSEPAVLSLVAIALLALSLTLAARRPAGFRRRVLLHA